METGTKRLISNVVWILMVAGVIAAFALGDFTHQQEDTIAKVFFLGALIYGCTTCFLFDEDDDEYRGGGWLILGIFAALCGMYICQYF